MTKIGFRVTYIIIRNSILKLFLFLFRRYKKVNLRCKKKVNLTNLLVTDNCLVYEL